MPQNKTALLWFRQDLRLTDNPALLHAVHGGYKILPVFILDDENAGDWKRGGAQRWWLHQSLNALNESLEGKLVFRSGDAIKIMPQLVQDNGARAVFWNRCYEPWRIKRDKQIKEDLKAQDIEAESFNAHLLWEPWQIKKEDGDPYKVFTPFYRKGCLNHSEPDEPRAAPKNIDYADFKERGSVDDLKLMPTIKWYQGMAKEWEPGEKGARRRLDDFLEDGLRNYKEDRNRPDLKNVSRLSPHLHHGEISPRTVWHEAQIRGRQAHWDKDMDHFCSELGWREFSYSLLYHFPSITWENLQPKFNAFPWKSQESDDLKAWQCGQTGVPMVDAGMRELWQTGYMHNRVRMIVGSFLVKNLLIHWHRGEEWFWDTLVDADLANNSASWQWIAGSGADAAPYFRIFNPVTQGQKFDPNGDYVRQYVPELKNLPDKYLHAPWEADEATLEKAGVELGKTYPRPIVDLKESRERALEAFESTKKAA